MTGSLVLYSTSPVPAPNHIVRRLRERGLIDDTLRLVVLQAALDDPQVSEVTILRDQFTVDGVRVEALDPGVQQRDDAFRPDAVEAIQHAHIVLATGGSPERMVKVLRDTPVLAAMRQAYARRGWIGGGSAGAMAFGAGMPGIAGEAIDFLGWVPFVIVPHFGAYSLAPWKAAFPDQPILGLPDGAVAILEETTIHSVGTVPLEIHDHLTGSVTTHVPGMSTTWDHASKSRSWLLVADILDE